jgi:hypothetical protein
VVHLVEADGQRVLVAVDATGVRCMAHLPPAFEVPGEEGAAGERPAAAAATPPHRGLLDRDQELRRELAGGVEEGRR